MDENFTPDTDESATPFLSSRLYNQLKWVTLILLPAVSAAYFALSAVLGLPAAEQVVGTIAVVCTFLGTILGFSTKQYNNSDQAFDGNVILVPDEEAEFTDVNFSVKPSALESGQKELRLRVRRA